MQWPSITSDWCSRSNYLVCVAASDEAGLIELAARAGVEGIAMTIVREPDFQNEITAVALEPGDAARRLCANLALALGRTHGISLARDRIAALERSTVPG